MKYPEDFLNKVIQGDCLEVMKQLPDKCIDLVVTSPPYDGLRDYNGYSFDFEGTASELFRVIKDGGIVVWVVGDSVIDGSESGTSFKQALFFKEIGFNLYDTMIWRKPNAMPQINRERYTQSFEYMFVLSKVKPRTTNIGEEKTKFAGKILKTFTTNPESIRKQNKNKPTKDFKLKQNIWDIKVFGTNYGHPAIFPEELAANHIKSWSNEGDIVLDPFNGSGTTTKMAKQLNRKYIGIEISEKYCKIANDRLRQDILL